MANRVATKLPSFAGVAAGQTATLSLPAAGKYFMLQLTYGTATAGGATKANMIAELTEVRVKVNGVVQRTFSVTQLFGINAAYGVAFATGLLPIFFAEPWMRTVQGEEILGWGMGDVQTFDLEVDIASGAASPTLSAIAVRDLTDNSAMGAIIKWRRNVVQVAGTGQLTYSQLPRNPNEAYKMLHAFEATAADITSVLVRIDNLDVYDLTNAQASALYADAGFAMQSGVFSVGPYMQTGQFGSMWSMAKAGTNPVMRVQDFQVNFLMAVAANFTLVQEVLGLRD